MLDSDSVSRRHARVEHRDGHLYVVDLDSTNGTFVNDGPEPTTHSQLRQGDQLKIGDTIFKYLSGYLWKARQIMNDLFSLVK